MADVDHLQVASLDSGPVPLSFPAVLHNSKLSDRFAHLRVASQEPPRQRSAKKDRPEPEGKRWIRRRENAKFTHNPHIIPPTNLDFVHPLQLPLSTFPHPLPTYLPRTLPIPPASPSPSLSSTSSAGLFFFSLRGARRTLRARPSSAYLVKAVETHLVAWLEGGTYLSPDQAKGLLRFPGEPVGGQEDIREVGREAGRLVWGVKADSAVESPGYGDGGFERYVVHCVARWYGVISFSKEVDGRRLTYLLRPNITRPDPRVNAASRTLDTPPTTDASDPSLSDFNNPTDGSDDNSIDASDVDSTTGDLPTHTDVRSLSDIEESGSSSPDSWSNFGETNFAIDSDNGVDDRGFTASMESLSLSAHADVADVTTPLADMTFTSSRPRNAPVTIRAVMADVELRNQDENPMPSRARADRDRLGRLYPRSASSPSPVGRSPHRFYPTRKLGARRKRRAKNDKKGFAGAAGTDKGLFYDYLFA